MIKDYNVRIAPYGRIWKIKIGKTVVGIAAKPECIALKRELQASRKKRKLLKEAMKNVPKKHPELYSW